MWPQIKILTICCFYTHTVGRILQHCLLQKPFCILCCSMIDTYGCKKATFAVHNRCRQHCWLDNQVKTASSSIKLVCDTHYLFNDYCTVQKMQKIYSFWKKDYFSSKMIYQCLTSHTGPASTWEISSQVKWRCPNYICWC